MSRGCPARPQALWWGLASECTLGCRLHSTHLRLLCPPPIGKVYQWEDPDPKLFDRGDGPDPADPTDPTATFRLSQGDVYKELRLRGYDYGPYFQGILETNLEGRAPRPPLMLGERALGPPPFRPHWA